MFRYNRQFRYEERNGAGYVKGRYGFFDKEGKLQVKATIRVVRFVGGWVIITFNKTVQPCKKTSGKPLSKLESSVLLVFGLLLQLTKRFSLVRKLQVNATTPLSKLESSVLLVFGLLLLDSYPVHLHIHYTRHTW